MRFFLKGFFLVLPLLLILGYFIITDPMKCIYNYSSPIERGVTMNDRIYQYRWLVQKPHPYNAFIFGSSRSKSFFTSSWVEHIGPAVPFNMGVNNESVYGIARKLEFIDRSGYEIKYALFLFDERMLRRVDNQKQHIFREHPAVSGESYTSFYQHFLTAFLKPSFLLALISKKKGFPGDEDFFFNVYFSYDKITGDHYYIEYEDELKANEDSFYSRQQRVFYNRDYAYTYKPVQRIDKIALGELQAIKKILDKHSTQYRIVITPNYDQKKLHPTDLEILKNIFGPDQVFDFSGINWYTSDVRHYYEERHFRPFVADSILKKIY